MTRKKKKNATPNFRFQTFHFYKILHTNGETDYFKCPKKLQKKKADQGINDFMFCEREATPNDNFIR